MNLLFAAISEAFNSIMLFYKNNCFNFKKIVFLSVLPFKGFQKRSLVVYHKFFGQRKGLD